MTKTKTTKTIETECIPSRDEPTEFQGLSRSILIAIILTQRARIETLEKECEAHGIQIKGWRCECGIFNGEEHSPRVACRSCGKGKHSP